jgi:GAF domain-containing protein
LNPRRSALWWLARWKRFAGLTLSQHEPGFLGPLPYVLILRYFVAGAVAIRFILHRSQYTPDQWWDRLLVVGLIAATAAAATYVTFNSKLRRSRLLQTGLILTDIGFISVAYWLTNNPESDFFLFYYLPIFAAVEYLGDNKTQLVAACIAVVVGMAVVVFFMRPMPSPPWTPSGLLWRVLVPRGLFFLAVVLTSAFVFQGLSYHQVELRGLLDSLHAVGVATPNALTLDQTLESILSELTETWGFDFATISLVDDYRNCIETVRGRNVPLGMLRRSKYRLDSRDIQADIARTGKTEIIEGWDERFNREIYERFEHWRLARVFAPIVSGAQHVVGTIEAGCAKERRADVITTAAIENIQRLGREKGDTIARIRPHALLELIAKQAIHLIGADSASLYVYRRTTHDPSKSGTPRWGELLLAAGAGKATPTFLQAHPPRPTGRAWTAVRTGRLQVIDDPQVFALEYPVLYGRGVRALAVIPLRLGPDAEGMLGISFWQNGRQFTESELRLAGAFAREMEVAIQNHLLFRSATEIAGRAWALSELQSLRQSLSSPFHLTDVLDKLAKNALLTLDANNVTVYQYHAETATFDVPPVMQGDFLYPAPMKVQITPDGTPLKVIEGGESRFVVDAQNDPILGAPTETGRLRFVQQEGVASCAALVLRPPESTDIVGLIFVNFREPHDFSPEEKRVMSAFATSAALAIRTARLHDIDITRRTGELEAIHAVDTAIVEKGPNIKGVLELILEKAVRVTAAQYGEFMWFNRQTQLLESMARWGMQDRSSGAQRIGEGIIGLAAQKKESILIEDVSSDTVYKQVNPDTRCELAVPLMDENHELLGVLNLEHAKPAGLNGEDRKLLETLAVPAIIAIRSVDLYQKLERQTKPLEALGIIAKRIQDAQCPIETILRLLLTGITARDGLGFSRALLFVQRGKSLRSEAAIGAMTREEAGATWTTLKDASLTSLLDEAVRFSDSLRGGANDTPLGTFLSSLPIDLDKAGALAKCILSGETVPVADGQDDRLRSEPFKSLALDHAFVCLPLLSKNKEPLGALLVDNRFLPGEREIDPATIPIAKTFAQLAAMSIENEGLRAEALLKSRFAAWKDLAFRAAHDLGNPIEAIDTYVLILRKRIERHRYQEVLKTAEDINVSLEQAKGVIARMKSVSKAQEVTLRPTNLLPLVKQACRVAECQGVELQIPEDTDPPFVLIDPERMAECLNELVANSLHWMDKAAKRIAVSFSTPRMQELPDTLDRARTYLRVTFQDSGRGVPLEHRERIFEPFFTTRASGGAGLGLFQVRLTVEALGGRIQVTGGQDEGAQFEMYLPVAEQGRG